MVVPKYSYKIIVTWIVIAFDVRIECCQPCWLTLPRAITRTCTRIYASSPLTSLASPPVSFRFPNSVSWFVTLGGPAAASSTRITKVTWMKRSYIKFLRGAGNKFTPVSPNDIAVAIAPVMSPAPRWIKAPEMIFFFFFFFLSFNWLQTKAI